MAASADFTAFTAATSLRNTPIDFNMKKREEEYYTYDNLTLRMIQLRKSFYNERRLSILDFTEIGFAQVAKLLERLNARVEALEVENTALKERVTVLESKATVTGSVTVLD
jgi:hypothetical protein